MTWEEDEGFRAPSLEGSLVGCDMRDDEIAIRSRALSSADLQVSRWGLSLVRRRLKYQAGAKEERALPILSRSFHARPVPML